MMIAGSFFNSSTFLSLLVPLLFFLFVCGYSFPPTTQFLPYKFEGSPAAFFNKTRHCLIPTCTLGMAMSLSLAASLLILVSIS